MIESKLRIAEIFASVQGEGIWVGVPSVFVRVSGCNLRCSWCDTPYASWKPEGLLQAVDEIFDRVIGVLAPPCHAVLTGGEPMVFGPTVELARRLREVGYTITIETAGTVYRELACDLMSISPKLANSTPIHKTWTKRHEGVRLRRSPLRRLIAKYPAHQLKFVINPEGDQDDIGEVQALLSDLGHEEPGKVLLMAEGIDSATQHRRQALLAPICMANGWRLSPRMHIDLFGNTRGT